MRQKVEQDRRAVVSRKNAVSGFPGRYAIVAVLLMMMVIGVLAAPGQAAEKKKLTNDDCFKCHKETNLRSGGLQGDLQVLFIDKERFMQTLHGKKLVCLDCHYRADNKTHLRTGYRQVSCLTCHSKIKGLDPDHIRERLEKRNIKIPAKKMVGESFLKSVHGKALLAGKKDAANCYDCHTIHYPMGPKKLQSTVHPRNLKQTCSRCHRERDVKGLFSRMAAFRVQAHRKADLRFSFTRDACVDCHQGDAAHGEKELKKTPCLKCHQKKIQPAGLMFGRFHLFPNHDQQYSVWIMRNVYGVLFSIIILLFVCWGLYVGLRRIAKYYQEQENK